MVRYGSITKMIGDKLMANFTTFLTGMGMVLDISGTSLPPQPPKASELASIGEDFKKVGAYLSFAVEAEKKLLQEREATQLRLKLAGV